MSDNLPPLPEYAHEFRPRWPGDDGGFSGAQMRAYATAAVAAERERCAKLALRQSRVATTPSAAVALVNFANELRAGVQP
jgi:hypothetical protein